MKILWLVVAICSAFGILTGLIPALTLAKSAPQEAALAAIGVAWAVIPYCFVKAISMMKPRSVIVETNKD